MTDINSVCMVGRLTRDVEVKYTNGGMAIGNFAIAVNRSVKKNDQWTDEANFFEVTVFGKQVENIQQYLTKGKQVAIEGYLKQDRWQKDGQNFSRVGIIADSIQLFGSKESGNSSGNSYGGNKIAPNNNYGGGNDDFTAEEFKEDIPF